MIEGVGGRLYPLQPQQEMPGLSGGSGPADRAGAPGPGGIAGAPASPGAAPGEGFASTFKEFLGSVNEMQLRSDAMVGAFARGEVQDLHQVVLAQQEAAIALRLVTEMRDRLVQAYQDVMRTTM